MRGWGFQTVALHFKLASAAMIVAGTDHPAIAQKACPPEGKLASMLKQLSIVSRELAFSATYFNDAAKLYARWTRAR